MRLLKNLFLLSSYLIVLCITVQAQVYQDWAIKYNGSYNDHDMGRSVAIDDSGNVYVTGISLTSGTTYDFLTIKYNSQGVEQWISGFGGPSGKAEGRKIAIDNDGNIYAAGESLDSAGTIRYFTTIKYNPEGIEQWVAIYNTFGFPLPFGSSFLWDMAVDDSANIYVTGESPGNGTGLDFLTVKYNSEGTELWAVRYDRAGYFDNSYAIDVDNSGNVYVAGRSVGSDQKSYFTLIKYNSSGVQQWIQFNSRGIAYDLIVDDLSNVYATGHFSDDSTFSMDYLTVKYNSSGILQWTQIYNASGGSEPDDARAIAADKFGNIYVTGASMGISTPYEITTIKYDSQGNQQWVQGYGGPGGKQNWGYAIIVDTFQNVYVAGKSSQIPISPAGFLTVIKYDSTGQQQWIQLYDGSVNHQGENSALDIALNDYGNIYVTGYCEGIDTMIWDYVTIKYCQQPDSCQQTVGIEENLLNFSNNNNIFPNPYKNKTTLHINSFIPNTAYTFVLYDLSGREVKRIEDIKTDKIIINRNKLPKGVYFYKLSASESSFIYTTGKLIIQ